MVGDCWIALSLDGQSGLILAARAGKHTDETLSELMVTTKGKTDCKQWSTDDWGGYEMVLPPEVTHYIGKDKNIGNNKTQRLERTKGIVRQQTGRGHRRRLNLADHMKQSKVIARLVVGYFNWIGKHSRLQTTAA